MNLIEQVKELAGSSRRLLCAAALVGILICLGFGQVSALSWGDTCAPDNPAPDCPPPPPIGFRGPVSVVDGQIYVQDRNYSQKSVVVIQSDVPYYIVVLLPPTAVSGFVAIIQYFPPNYQISNFLESPWKPMSGGGAKTFGGYVPGQADPRGKYAFKALLWFNDGTGWKYSEPVTFVDIIDQTVTTVTPTVTTVTTTQDPGGDPGNGLIAMVVCVMALVALLAAVVAVRRRPPSHSPPSASSRVKYCLSCGAPMAPETIFCPKCGVNQYLSGHKLHPRAMRSSREKRPRVKEVRSAPDMPRVKSVQSA